MTGTSPVTGWFRDPELCANTAGKRPKLNRIAVVLRAAMEKFSLPIVERYQFGGAEMRSSGRGLCDLPATPY
jgi:hypothetical protein